MPAASVADDVIVVVGNGSGTWSSQLSTIRKSSLDHV